MWDLEYKESWAPKNWCFWTVVLEKTLENPLDCKEIQPVHPKGNQSWVFIGKTDVEAETPILWPPDVKNWLVWKDPEAGKTGGGRRRGRQRWDGWMASPTQWLWVWAGSGSWWWTGKPGVLQSMGLQRVGNDWVNWTELWETHLGTQKHFLVMLTGSPEATDSALAGCCSVSKSFSHWLFATPWTVALLASLSLIIYLT